MIGWLALAAAGVVLVIVSAAVWRRWIEPWRELEELVEAVSASKPPRKFLMTANRRANKLGLALEQFALRQRELDQRSNESSRSLGAILRALPDGLAVVDEQRRLQVANDEFRRLFNPGAEERGMPLLEATREAAADRAVARALAESEVRRDRLKLGGGEAPLHIEVSAVPFRAEGMRKAGAVVLFRDVTQIQQVEAMRRDFVANVSHELRTPLSIFRGYLETLLDDPRQPADELIRILEVMDRHAERLTLLVEDILSLAQLESPAARLDLSEIYLPDFLGGILRDWEKRFGTKPLRATLEAADDLPVITADENRLQEIIYNLLDNAVKYSRPEGNVWLRTARVGDSVRISVTDEGIGIPASALPRVFERFYRADKARSREIGGTGLGLSIVKHIAQLHGGSVEAESEIGRGSTISVLLPLGRKTDMIVSPEPSQSDTRAAAETL
ncbi:N/A [soil metagenome]